MSADREATAGYNISRFDEFDNWSRRTNFNARVGVDFTPNLNVDASMRYVDRITSIDVQPFVPERVYWNSTLATPEPDGSILYTAANAGPSFDNLKSRIAESTLYGRKLVRKLMLYATDKGLPFLG